MQMEFEQLKKVHLALKTYSSGTDYEIAKDLEYVAGMVHILEVLGYNAWNENGKWSVREIESGKMLICKDKAVKSSSQ